MRKLQHHFTVYATDDHTADTSTRWKLVRTLPTRREAWDQAKTLVKAKYFRHVKITETRIYSGATK